jgi:general secretion pathway protein A
MRAMINYRLNVASDFEIDPSLFSFWGIAAIYLATGGYPRKVVFLCHQVILTMIIRGKNKAGWFLVISCVSEMGTPLFKRLKWALASVLIIIALGSIGAIILQIRNADAYKQSSAISSIPVVSEVEQVSSASVVPDPLIVQGDKNKEMKIPTYLGKLTMTKRRTIWWTLHNIYGVVNPKIAKAVLEVNPHIRNKDRVAEGDIITLPSIPADIKPINENDIVVIVEKGKNLETVYNIFRESPDLQNISPLVFFPFWNKKEGIEFAIVIDKCFKNIHDAEEAVGKLPPMIAAKTKILSQREANTVFFNRHALQN